MADPIAISYSLQDSKGKKNSVIVDLLDTTALADALDFGTDFSALLDNITECQIISASLIQPVTLDVSCKGAPVALSDVQKGALFSFNPVGTSRRYSLRVPALIESLFSGENVTIAPGDDVDDFVQALVQGLTPNATLVQPTDLYNNNLGALISAVMSFRRK